MKDRKSLKLHFVGIGGIGMSGIAEVFQTRGYTVSGSDLHESESTKHLEKLGVKIFLGHRAENVQDADCVVVSSAIRENNPERVEAKKRLIPVIPRAEMLGELMRDKIGIAVAGSHGKTTTTSMLAMIFQASELDPTVVVGGKVDRLGGNAKHGEGRFVIAEADESDGSFLHLPATYAIITNIDNDHLDHFGSLNAVKDAFVSFIAKLPFYGRAAVCIDDVGVKQTLLRFTKPILTYGRTKEADLYADQINLEASGSTFDVYFENKKLGKIQLVVPGEHNVLNALGAIAMALEAGVNFEKIAQGLLEFRGAKRRFEIKYQNAVKNQAVVDDYGHHPTEILATLEAARRFWPNGRIVVAFQPHRYSRTLHCREGFLAAFHQADELYISEIYSAGEDPIPGVSGLELCASIAKISTHPETRHFIENLEQLRNQILHQAKPGDLILCCGAGSITKLSDEIAIGLSSV